MMESLPSPKPQDGPARSSSLGEGLGVATLTAVPLGLALGLVHPDSGRLVGLALAGALALLAGLPGALLRQALPLPLGLRALLWGTLLAMTPLALLGRALAAGTHHRPLGAVTFALLAAGVLFGAWVVMLRLLVPVGEGPLPLAAVQRWLARLIRLLIAVSATGMVYLALRSGAAVQVAEFAALSLVLVAAALVPWVRAKRRPGLGWVLWLLIVGAGAGLRVAGPSGVELKPGAPLLLGLLP
jgi:hypothetical protein